MKLEKEFIIILEKIIVLYRKYGVKSITMDDIAKEMGISKKTIYKYVKNKNELVNKAVLYDIQRHYKHVESIKEKKLNAIEELFEVNKYINDMLLIYNPVLDYDLKKYFRDTYKELFKMRRRQLLKSIEDNLKKGINEGYYRKNLNYKVIAKFHLLRIENMSNRDIISIEEFASPDLFNEVFRYHIRGIASNKGIDYIENKFDKSDK